MAEYISKDIAVSIVRLCFSEHGKFETHSSLMNFICASLSADVTTADFQPVVHAHWMPMESQLHVEKSGACANCGEAWPISDTEYFYYCPNCGAKMEEVQLDERTDAR